MKLSWHQLPKPFLVLAPMADVTDRAYRTMIHRYSRMGEKGGGPAVLWTEFVSADGLSSRGKYQLLRDLQYFSYEQPIVAQIFGSNPKTIEESARLIADLGFAGLDINMGCPDQTINKQGAGACLIRTPALAQEIIKCAQIAVEGRIPVSVKTRIGWSKDETESWIPALLDTGIEALTIHARTRSEMSDYPPHWDIMQRVVERTKNYNTVLIGNGGLMSREDAYEMCKKTGAGGAMIGKGTFGTPWFFDSEKNSVTTEERINQAIEHTKLYEQYLIPTIGKGYPSEYLEFGDHPPIQVDGVVKGKPFAIMRKNYKAYIHGFDSAKELRIALMSAETPKEAVELLKNSLSNL